MGSLSDSELCLRNQRIKLGKSSTVGRDASRLMRDVLSKRFVSAAFSSGNCFQTPRSRRRKSMDSATTNGSPSPRLSPRLGRWAASLRLPRYYGRGVITPEPKPQARRKARTLRDLKRRHTDDNVCESESASSRDICSESSASENYNWEHPDMPGQKGRIQLLSDSSLQDSSMLSNAGFGSFGIPKSIYSPNRSVENICERCDSSSPGLARSAISEGRRRIGRIIRTKSEPSSRRHSRIRAWRNRRGISDKNDAESSVDSADSTPLAPPIERYRHLLAGIEPPENMQRKYIKDGPVVLSAGVQTQERHLFLFNDILLIAKKTSIKGQPNHKVKEQVRVAEIWINRHCVDEISESSSRPTGHSFVIGWPTTNYVAQFESDEVKESWYQELEQLIAAEKDREYPKVTTIRVYYKQLKSDEDAVFLVNNQQNVNAVLKIALAEFDISGTDVQSQYQLWVYSGKESTPYPLSGHESPFAIYISHLRDLVQSEPNFKLPPLIELENLARCAVYDPRCHFVLKHKRSTAKKQRNRTSGRSIVNQIKRKIRDKQDSTDPPSSPKLFSVPLDLYSSGQSAPDSVLQMINRLFESGLYAEGIFRRAPKAATVRDVKKKLDSGIKVLFDSLSPYVAASLLKEYLRSLPECLLLKHNVPSWSRIMDLPSESKLAEAKHLLCNLPSVHMELLQKLVCLLYHIDNNAEINQMNAKNLAICIPFAFIPPPPEQTTNSECQRASEITQYIIENTMNLFGEDIIALLGSVPDPPRDSHGSSEESDSLACPQNDASSIDSLDGLTSPFTSRSHSSLRQVTTPHNSHDSGIENESEASAPRSLPKNETDIPERPCLQRSYAYDDCNEMVKSVDSTDQQSVQNSRGFGESGIGQPSISGSVAVADSVIRCPDNLTATSNEVARNKRKLSSGIHANFDAGAFTRSENRSGNHQADSCSPNVNMSNSSGTASSVFGRSDEDGDHKVQSYRYLKETISDLGRLHNYPSEHRKLSEDIRYRRSERIRPLNSSNAICDDTQDPGANRESDDGIWTDGVFYAVPVHPGSSRRQFEELLDKSYVTDNAAATTARRIPAHFVNSSNTTRDRNAGPAEATAREQSADESFCSSVSNNSSEQAFADNSKQCLQELSNRRIRNDSRQGYRYAESRGAYHEDTLQTRSGNHGGRSPWESGRQTFGILAYRNGDTMTDGVRRRTMGSNRTVENRSPAHSGFQMRISNAVGYRTLEPKPAPPPKRRDLLARSGAKRCISTDDDIAIATPLSQTYGGTLQLHNVYSTRAIRTFKSSESILAAENDLFDTSDKRFGTTGNRFRNSSNKLATSSPTEYGSSHNYTVEHRHPPVASRSPRSIGCLSNHDLVMDKCSVQTTDKQQSKTEIGILPLTDIPRASPSTTALSPRRTMPTAKDETPHREITWSVRKLCEFYSAKENNAGYGSPALSARGDYHRSGNETEDSLYVQPQFDSSLARQRARQIAILAIDRQHRFHSSQAPRESPPGRSGNMDLSQEDSNIHALPAQKHTADIQQAAGTVENGGEALRNPSRTRIMSSVPKGSQPNHNDEAPARRPHYYSSENHCVTSSSTAAHRARTLPPRYISSKSRLLSDSGFSYV